MTDRKTSRPVLKAGVKGTAVTATDDDFGTKTYARALEAVSEVLLSAAEPKAPKAPPKRKKPTKAR